MKTIALIVTLGVLLVGSVAAMVVAWRSAGIDIGLFGWIVLSVAVVLSVALGAGLMWLSFMSARRGYDDRVASSDDIDEA